MRTIKSCGVLLVKGRPPREFLLMRHADRLDLPKGHIEPGESDLECALREMEEETGIPRQRVEIDLEFRFTTEYLVRPKRFQYEPCLKTCIIFLGLVSDDTTIVTTEHLGYEWWRWNPPHRIQVNTIDPLLTALEEFLRSR